MRPSLTHGAYGLNMEALLGLFLTTDRPPQASWTGLAPVGIDHCGFYRSAFGGAHFGSAVVGTHVSSNLVNTWRGQFGSLRMARVCFQSEIGRSDFSAMGAPRNSSRPSWPDRIIRSADECSAGVRP